MLSLLITTLLFTPSLFKSHLQLHVVLLGSCYQLDAAAAFYPQNTQLCDRSDISVIYLHHNNTGQRLHWFTQHPAEMSEPQFTELDIYAGPAGPGEAGRDSVDVHQLYPFIIK